MPDDNLVIPPTGIKGRVTSTKTWKPGHIGDLLRAGIVRIQPDGQMVLLAGYAADAPVVVDETPPR